MTPEHLQHPTRRPLRLPEVPEVPRQPPDVKIQPPTVFVHPVWEYKHLVRKRPTEPPPEDADLNVLGAEGWELVRMFVEADALHFYFKRLVT